MAVLAIAAGIATIAGLNESDAGDTPRFVDVSDRLPVRQPRLGPGRPGKFIGFGPLWLDADGDGDPDLFYMNHGILPSMFENRDGRFVDRRDGSGIATRNWSYPQQGDRHGTSCADFDNDGRIDIHIAHGAKRGETLGVKRDELLQNHGGFVFHDIAGSAGVSNAQGRGRLAAWADFDGDGWLDVYLMNYRSANVVYRNRGDGTFEDASSQLDLDPDKQVAAWTDYDLDGDADLLLSPPLRLMRNDRGGRFADVTRESGLESVNVNLPLGLAWRDFDNDGDPDVFVTGRHSAGRLLVNDNGRFRSFDPSMSWGHEPGTEGNGAVWGDVDNDGWPDLLLTHSNGIVLFMNRLGKGFWPGRFAAAEQFDMAHGGEAALADFDGDGFLDVAFNAVGTNYLYRNRGGDGAWLAVSFEGRASNRTGFGARILADVRGPDGRVRRLSRQYYGDSGVFRSIGCAPLHIGLGDAESADLKIEWPSGVTQRVDDVRVNRSITITEPPAPARE